MKHPRGGVASSGVGTTTTRDDVGDAAGSPGRTPPRTRRLRRRPSLGSWNGAEERDEEEARLHTRRRSTAAASSAAAPPPPLPSPPSLLSLEPARGAVVVVDDDDRNYRRFDDDYDDPLDAPLPLSPRRMRRGGGGGGSASVVVGRRRRRVVGGRPGLVGSSGAGTAASSAVVPNVRIGPSVVFPGYLRKDRGCLRSIAAGPGQGRGGDRDGDDEDDDDRLFLRGFVGGGSGGVKKARPGNATTKKGGAGATDVAFGETSSTYSDSSRRRRRRREEEFPHLPRGSTVDYPDEVFGDGGGGFGAGGGDPSLPTSDGKRRSAGRRRRAGRGRVRSEARTWDLADVREGGGAEPPSSAPRAAAAEEEVTISLEGLADELLKDFSRRWSVADDDDDDTEAAVKGGRDDAADGGGKWMGDDRGDDDDEEGTIERTRIRSSTTRERSVVKHLELVDDDIVVEPPARDGIGSGDVLRGPAPDVRRDADPRDDDDAITIVKKNGSAKTSRVRSSERRPKGARGDDDKGRGATVESGGDDSSRRRRKKKRRKTKKVVKMRQLLAEQSSLETERRRLEDQMRDVDAKLSAAEEEGKGRAGRRPSGSSAPERTTSRARTKSELNELRSKMRRIEAERERRRIALTGVERTIDDNTTDLRGLRRELAKCMPKEMERAIAVTGGTTERPSDEDPTTGRRQSGATAIRNDRTTANKDRTIEELEQEVNVKERTIESLEAWVEAAQEELADSESRRVAAERTLRAIFEEELRRMGNEMNRLRERSERSEERVAELEGRVAELEEALRRRGGSEGGAVAVVDKTSSSLPRLLMEDRVVMEATEEGGGHMERERGMIEAAEECEVSNNVFEALPQFYEAADCPLVASEEGAAEDAQRGPRIERNQKTAREGNRTRGKDADERLDPPALMGEDSVEEDCATTMLGMTVESDVGGQMRDAESSFDEDSTKNADGTYDDGCEGQQQLFIVPERSPTVEMKNEGTLWSFVEGKESPYEAASEKQEVAPKQDEIGRESHGAIPESGGETAEPSDAKLSERLEPASRHSSFDENVAPSRRDVAFEPTTDALGKSADANERSRNRGKLAEVIAEYHKSGKTSRGTLATATTADLSLGGYTTATAADECAADSVDPAWH